MASFFVFVGKLAIRFLDVIVLMVLTRILTPTDFGVIAMAKIAILIIEAITELPIATALVRQEKINESMLNTALTLGILRGTFISIFILISAYPLANFYQERHIVYLMFAMALSPIFRGITSPKIVEDLRAMNFKKQILQEGIGKIFALIASIAYALIFRDYWAMVIMMVVAPAVTSFASFVFFPIKFKPSLKELGVFKDIVQWNFFSQVLIALNWQLDKLILPVFISSRVFGFYSIYTEFIAMIQQTLVIPINGPVFVSFQQAKKNEQLLHHYNLTLNVMFTIVAPIYGFVACFPEQIISVFFGEKWLIYSNILQALSIISIISIPTYLFAPLANVLYRNKELTMRTFIIFMVNMPVTLLAVNYYGMRGAVLAKFISTIVGVLLTIKMTSQFISSGYRSHFNQLIRSISALVLTYFVLDTFVFNFININQLHLILNFFISGLLYLMIYFVIIFCLWLIFGKKMGFEYLALKRINQLFNKKA